MDLEEDIASWEFGVNALPDSVDEEPDGGLRYPSGSSIEHLAVDPVEEINTISESVLNMSRKLDSPLNIILPLCDSGEASQVPTLDALSFRNTQSKSFGKSAGSSKVICTVGEGLESSVSGISFDDSSIMVEFSR